MFKEILKKNPILHSLLKKLKWLYLSIKNFKSAKKANSLITEESTIHLMMNDKFIKPCVDFLNINFPNEKNVFLCKRWFSFDFPEAENVVEIKTFAGIKLKKAKRIICHSLFDEEIINRFYAEKKLLNKSYWLIWGGDMTNKRVKHTKKVRYVFGNFYAYRGKTEEKYAKEHFNVPKDKDFQNFTYSFPVNKNVLDKAYSEPKDYIQIQISQSIHVSAIEVMEWLSKYKNKNIRICSILSYGESGNTKQLVKEAGIKLFGNKYHYIETFMKPEEYANHVASNDILILNNDHQDGYGNTLAHLYLGKKVFIRSDVPTPEMLKSYGITVYPTEKIPELSFEELIEYNQKEENIKNTRNLLDENFMIDGWKKIYNDSLNGENS